MADIELVDVSKRFGEVSVIEKAEMQRTPAWRIDARVNGAFVVTREDEVADQKRTDPGAYGTDGKNTAMTYAGTATAFLGIAKRSGSSWTYDDKMARWGRNAP